MSEQVPERAKDVPSYGDLGPNIVLVVVGREATAAELGWFRVVIQADEESCEVVKDNVGIRIVGPDETLDEAITEAMKP